MADFLSTLFGGGAEKEAAQKDIAAANAYGATSNAALGAGYATGTDAINKGIGAYAPLADMGKAFMGTPQAYLDALGVNGPAGNQRALTNFQAGPGYEFTKEQTLQALARSRAVGGMGASGNADIDAMNYVSGLAGQGWQQNIQNLLAATGLGANITGQAAAGQASGYGSLANLAARYGEDQTGVAGNVMGTTVGANNLQAAGEAAGAKNLLGAGLSVASLAMGAPPGMFGGGGGGGTALMPGSPVPGAVGPTSVGGYPLRPAIG